MTLFKRTETSLQNPYVPNQDHNIYLISDNSTLTTTLIIFIKNIFHYQSHASNLNRTFSFILQHHETLQYHYLYASNNEQLLKPHHTS